MTSKYIVGSYGIMGGLLWSINKTSYKPKNEILKTCWEIPTIDTEHGKTAAIVSLVGAPLLLPVYGLGIGGLYTHDRFWYFVNKNKN